MRKNKRGLEREIMFVLIMGVVLAILVLLFWVGSMTLPLLFGLGQDVSSRLRTDIHINSPNSDLDNASTVALNVTDGVLGVGEVIVYICMFFIFLGFLALCFFVREYPFLAFFWIFIVIGLTLMSMFVSNAYQTAKLNSDIGVFYERWGANDFLFTNLPVLVVVFGVIGGIILFGLSSRDPTSEVQTL